MGALLWKVVFGCFVLVVKQKTTYSVDWVWGAQASDISDTVKKPSTIDQSYDDHVVQNVVFAHGPGHMAQHLLPSHIPRYASDSDTVSRQHVKSIHFTPT
ncbi:hypothetical protein EDD15DRAFT_2226644 [Pisolithus albus]|nr:hypothetical protein EDD15DRAFT_2226644 [Pisolithus albus]